MMLRTGDLPVRAAAGLLAAGLLAAGCAAAPTPSTPSSPPAFPASTRPASAQPTSPAATARPLAGKVVGIDPGHNGLNGTDPAFINHLIWNGREWEHCNTTGTQTADGYTEARFNFNVATYLAADLRALGATVVLTRHSNHGVGPCVNTRSFQLNHTDVAIDIHADGGPSWGRGFTVLEPVPDSRNAAVIGPSLRFGRYVHQAFVTDTPLRPSDYYGRNGYIVRNDLAGLNLTTVPKVLIECGNMRSAADAAVLTSPRGQREIARALLAAIVRFLTGRWPGR
jgi:N-acetylmuramoyl-L-alanine amidase